MDTIVLILIFCFSELLEMDERATRMSEWIEERMWLFETESEERKSG